MTRPGESKRKDPKPDKLTICHEYRLKLAHYTTYYYTQKSFFFEAAFLSALLLQDLLMF